MTDCSAEKWTEVYQKALMELGRAKIRGRIGDTRDEILIRVAHLKSLPGLDERERQGINDALNALLCLVQIEHEYDEDKRRRVLARAERELQFLAPRIKKLESSASG